MKKSLLILLLCISVYVANSQQNKNSDIYKTAIGLKIYPGAITAKHFINTNTAIEGIATLTNRFLRITALYEIHNKLGSYESLKWYYGGGAHIGFGGDSFFYSDGTYSGDEGTTIGLDGILGIDYKFKQSPLNLSIDWQPSIVIIGNTYFMGLSGGVSLRYAF